MDKQITMYQEFKKILSLISDGDNIISQAIRSALTINQIEIMESFVFECEDMGIHLLVRKTNPN